MGRNCNRFSEELENKILKLFDEGVSASQIGRELQHSTNTITRVLKRFGRTISDGKGKNHSGWKGGRGIKSGYWTVFYKGEHPRKLKIGRIFEHILIAEEKLGRQITKKEPIHHIDFNRLNNDPLNLYVCSGHSEHMKIHYSLESIARELFFRGIIEFKNGNYVLVEEIGKRLLELK